MLGEFSILILCTIPSLIHGHTYHFGGDCAPVEPMPGFNMDKFAGRWYAIQKTSTASRCMTYDFLKTEFRKVYKVQQLSENPLIGLVKDNVYNYTGNLEMKDENQQADMTVKFPLSITGKSSFIVFMTDYENYAGVYSCQKIGFTRRESATILSRKNILDKTYVDKIRTRLGNFNVDPYDLSIVSQTNCSFSGDKFSIHIDNDTFSQENLKKAVKKVGSAIGDGVDFLIKGAKKVYETVKKDDQHKIPEQIRDREEMTQRTHVYFEPNAELL